jgi:serine/threonine protein phosphatase PrpC
MRPIDLTTDHSTYNPAEVAAVLRRCNNAAGAISSGIGGGIKRVAGSLAVTRALGDAYLKTPLLSFHPFMRHVPYITARPEVNSRILPCNEGPKTNHILILATDGVWEQASGEDVLRWVRNYYAERTDAEKRSRMSQDGSTDQQVAKNEGKDDDKTSSVKEGLSPGSQKRKLRLRVRRRSPNLSMVQSTAADVIVRRVLNKVRRSRNMSSLNDLLSLPKGRARRCKHDDITTSVVDVGAFVS